MGFYHLLVFTKMILYTTIFCDRPLLISRKVANNRITCFRGYLKNSLNEHDCSHLFNILHQIPIYCLISFNPVAQNLGLTESTNPKLLCHCTYSLFNWNPFISIYDIEFLGMTSKVCLMIIFPALYFMDSAPQDSKLLLGKHYTGCRFHVQQFTAFFFCNKLLPICWYYLLHGTFSEASALLS